MADQAGVKSELHPVIGDHPAHREQAPVRIGPHATERFRVYGAGYQFRILDAERGIVDLSERPFASRDLVFAGAELGAIQDPLRLLLLKPLPVCRRFAVRTVNRVGPQTVNGGHVAISPISFGRMVLRCSAAFAGTLTYGIVQLSA